MGIDKSHFNVSLIVRGSKPHILKRKESWSGHEPMSSYQPSALKLSQTSSWTVYHSAACLFVSWSNLWEKTYCLVPVSGWLLFYPRFVFFHYRLLQPQKTILQQPPPLIRPSPSQSATQNVAKTAIPAGAKDGKDWWLLPVASQHHALGSGCPPLVLIYCQTQMKESGSETAGRRKIICFYASAARRRCVGVLGAVRKTVSLRGSWVKFASACLARFVWYGTAGSLWCAGFQFALCSPGTGCDSADWLGLYKKCWMWKSLCTKSVL